MPEMFTWEAPDRAVQAWSMFFDRLRLMAPWKYMADADIAELRMRLKQTPIRIACPKPRNIKEVQ
jgi:hypothetical protein